MKDKKKLLIFFWSFLVLLSSLSFIFIANGVSNRLYGTVIEKKILDVKTNNTTIPKINLLINSSGEEVVNENVSISTISDKKDGVVKIIYSSDLKKWNVSKNCKNNDENTICKIIFKNNINKTLYIRVIDYNGRSSYYSKTKVIIDKKKPKIHYSKTKKTVIFDILDNYYVSKIQYSNDLINWDTENLDEANKLKIEKESLDYKYVRVIDKAGNISKVVKIIR